MSARTIPILMYHQIDATPPKGSALRGLVVEPGTFRRHMAVLHALGYRGLSMTALEPYLRGERQGRVFGITFDDGYANNLHHALPVLQHFGFCATCYVVPDLLGQTNVWDAAQGIAQVPLMTAAELRLWVNGGQEVGSHTLSHAHLPSLSVAQLGHDIAQSKASLETILRQPVQHFCYPYGAWNNAALELVRSSGYTTATTTRRARASVGPGTDLLQLPRVSVSRTTTWAHLLLKCFTRYEDRRSETGAV